MPHSYIKVSTNRIPQRIKETVSIIDSKLLAIPSKSHLPYLSFKRFCSLINNRGMNEQGDKSDTLLSWGLGAELRACLSIFPSLFLPCQLNLGPDCGRKQGAVHPKWCDCWIRYRDKNAQQLLDQQIPPWDADKKDRTNTAANSIPDCLMLGLDDTGAFFTVMEPDCKVYL